MNAHVKNLVFHFNALQREVPLHPIRTQAEYDAAVASMNRLLDLGAADENHPLANLVATMGELIGDYDDAHYPIPEVTGVHQRQAGFECRHVKKLKLRFGVSADAFV